MDSEILSWFGNIINYLIFVFIFITAIQTSCFSIRDSYLSLVGLITSILIQIIVILNKEIK